MLTILRFFFKAFSAIEIVIIPNDKVRTTATLHGPQTTAKLKAFNTTGSLRAISITGLIR